MRKRYVNLTASEIDELSLLKSSGQSSRERNRAHALLLSNKGYDTQQLCEIFEINMTTLLNWLNRWESGGIENLGDKKKPGRPKTLRAAEEKK